MLKPGRVADFFDSMAEAMEQAFEEEWNLTKDFALQEAGKEDRKILFVAVARGMVRHLRERANDSFDIEVRVTQDISNPAISEGEATKVEILTDE